MFHSTESDSSANSDSGHCSAGSWLIFAFAVPALNGLMSIRELALTSARIETGNDGTMGQLEETVKTILGLRERIE